MFRKLLALAILMLPAAARAEWHEATSQHFIVYSDGSGDRLREAAAKLEKFDFLLRTVSGVTDRARTGKLKIYLLRSAKSVQETLSAGGGVAGYYSASARGPIAVGTQNDIGSGRNSLTAEAVLFHEYAHHFMFQHFPSAYPPWYSEGFAEYYSTTRILPRDVIEVGHPANHRYGGYGFRDWMPLSRLLTARSQADISGQIHLLYAQGWLLVHYLATNESRAGQLAEYLNAVNAGVDYGKAMDAAFGADAKELDRELRDYATRQQIDALRIPFKPIDVGAIEMRVLPPAEEALLRHEIALARGIQVRHASRFASEVRAIAERFPNDAYALSILAEAERAAGNSEAAAAAVEKWLAVEPGAPRALMHKGELRVAALKATGSSAPQAWDAARQMIYEAHKADPRDPMILEAYFDSFAAQGVLPTPGAQNAIVRALELVPQDSGIRYKVAADYEQRGLLKDAISVIKPTAFQLHQEEEEDPEKREKREQAEAENREVGDTQTETAREMLERLEKKLAAREKTPAVLEAAVPGS